MPKQLAQRVAAVEVASAARRALVRDEVRLRLERQVVDQRDSIGHFRPPSVFRPILNSPRTPGSNPCGPRDHGSDPCAGRSSLSTVARWGACAVRPGSGEGTTVLAPGRGGRGRRGGAGPRPRVRRGVRTGSGPGSGPGSGHDIDVRVQQCDGGDHRRRRHARPPSAGPATTRASSRASAAASTCTTASTGDSASASTRGGPTSWVDSGGYLPAQITTFHRSGTTVEITEFGDHVVLAGHAYVAVYCRGRGHEPDRPGDRRRPGTDVGVARARDRAGLVAPHASTVHDYVVAVDRFGGQYAWPSARGADRGRELRPALRAHARVLGRAAAPDRAGSRPRSRSSN